MKEIAKALNQAQAVMSGAKKDKKNPFYKSTYADLASVFDAIREPFAENGLSVSQQFDIHMETGRTILRTKLLHVSGECIDSQILIPEVQDCQKLGSATTYIRRYALMAIAGIPAEDDDGNEACKPEKQTLITKEQVQEIRLLINGHDDILEKIKSNTGGLEKITSNNFQRALSWVKSEIAAKEVPNE